MPRLLELWGGVECTLNRVGDSYVDQLAKSGHDARIDDLDRFARLGLRTLRYPFLWEKIAPDRGHTRWDWAEARLERLHALGIEPIAGLLHHGSGPPSTSLTDSRFAAKFARYARTFARRFPGIARYTPINEPTTTARFSALYGLWYPHLRDEYAFFRAVLNQCRATVVAMEAVRESNSAAELVQTEDLGRAQSTAPLAAQRDYENARRWLTFDLLCGRIDRGHPMWGAMLRAGIRADDIRWHRSHRCPPAVLGLNHYVLSNRFLDDRLERYPAHYHGGNGRERYADVDAVRVADAPAVPLDALLTEAWERYRIPLAITEAHIDCTREEQMRWLAHCWRMALAARARGADVVAVTPWGLLGHFDWHSLVTREEGYYVPGAFDLRGGEPRRTGLAAVVESLATEGSAAHPLLDEPGWWAREVRVAYPQRVAPPVPGGPGSYAVSRTGTRNAAAGAVVRRSPLLIAGATGTLGVAFARICEHRAIPYIALRRAELDVCDEPELTETVAQLRPWAIVNCAGYVRVDDAERERERCFRDNVGSAASVAAVCARHAIRLVAFSSDLVFDGRARSPYREGSRVGPLNVYGESKARAEEEILQRTPDALIVRTSTFFGPWDGANFLTQSLQRLRAGEALIVPAGHTFSPTYVPDLVRLCLDLLIDGAGGLWHLVNDGETSWFEFALAAAKLARLDAQRIREAAAHEIGRAAMRPAYSVLGTDRGLVLPPWQDAIERYTGAVASA